DGSLHPKPQPADGVTVEGKQTTADARIDWSAPASRVAWRVRARTPAPGAWTTFRGKRLKLAPLLPVDPADQAELTPGELRVESDEVLAGTGSGAVRLGDVQPEGRGAMPAAAWARGVRLGPGDVLE